MAKRDLKELAAAKADRALNANQVQARLRNEPIECDTRGIRNKQLPMPPVTIDYSRTRRRWARTGPPFSLHAPTANFPNGIYVGDAPGDWHALAARCKGSKTADVAAAIRYHGKVTGKPTGIMLHGGLLDQFNIAPKTYYRALEQLESVGLIKVVRPGDPGSKRRQKHDHVTILGPFIGSDKVNARYYLDAEPLRPTLGGKENRQVVGWTVGGREFIAVTVPGTKFQVFYLDAELYRAPYYDALVAHGVRPPWIEDFIRERFDEAAAYGKDLEQEFARQDTELRGSNSQISPETRAMAEEAMRDWKPDEIPDFSDIFAPRLLEDSAAEIRAYSETEGDSSTDPRLE